MSQLKPEREVVCAHCNGSGKVKLEAEANTVEAYYFGCWHDTGHYLHNKHGRSDRSDGPIVAALPTALCIGSSVRMDGWWAPGVIDLAGRAKNTKPEVECDAALHHFHSWTVLAWWDRSIDKRSGSNSALLVAGRHDFTAMVEIGKAQFPRIMKRQKHTTLRLVETKEHT